MAKKYIESNVITYQSVNKITGFTCEITGENSLCYYNKEFRFSHDNILWSDYRALTNENLGKIIPENENLYIQYRFTQVGVGQLSVENISLHMVYNKEVEKVIPDCYWTSVNTNRYSPQIVYNPSNNNLFNPYAIGNGLNIYSQMSTLVSNMFGLCVLYFKTDADAKTRDVVLKEYSIEHVIDKQNVKILVPDNQLPTRELQFNSMMIDYPVQFEVHIVKSEFQKMFGANSHPDPHDYLYFQAYMNKMYMVDSVSEADDFGYTGSYWRVSLVPYQELSSVKFASDDLQEDTETLIFSAEGKFEEEVKDEYMDVRKDNQLNDLGDWQEGQDFLRRYLDPNVRIVQEKVYNDWTLIADSHYDLSTIAPGQNVNEYRYTTGFGSNDERMLSFIYKPDMTKAISDNIMIKNITKGKHGGIRIEVAKWSKIFKVGNIVKIAKTSDLNGFKKILFVNPKLKILEVEGELTNKSQIFNCAKITGYEYNNMFTIRNEEGTCFEIAQIADRIIINFLGENKFYEFEDFGKFESKWYCFVLGMKGGMSNLWLYQLNGSEVVENMKAKLEYIGKASNDLGQFNFGSTCFYDIMSCNGKITNIRLWDTLCEEEKHNLILSQLVVDDTHNTLIVDNAKSELLLNNKYS